MLSLDNQAQLVLSRHFALFSVVYIGRVPPLSTRLAVVAATWAYLTLATHAPENVPARDKYACTGGVSMSRQFPLKMCTMVSKVLPSINIAFASVVPPRRVEPALEYVDTMRNDTFVTSMLMM